MVASFNGAIGRRRLSQAWRWAPRSHASLLRDIVSADGASAIEYALLLPLLLVLILATLEFCVMDLASDQLDAGLAELARQGQTGQLLNTPYNAATMKAALLAHLTPAALFTDNQLLVSAQTYNGYQLERCAPGFFEPCWTTGQYQDLNGDGVRDLVGGTPGTGDAGSVVIYSASYNWSGITPVWKLMQVLFGGAIPQSTLISHTLIQNEPFPSP